jgi:hypothetical protein
VFRRTHGQKDPEARDKPTAECHREKDGGPGFALSNATIRQMPMHQVISNKEGALRMVS